MLLQTQQQVIGWETPRVALADLAVFKKRRTEIPVAGKPVVLQMPLPANNILHCRLK